MRCERVKRARPLLGTIVEISLSGSNASELHTCADAAFDSVARIHELMSFHSAGSDVSRFNNSLVGETVQIDSRTWHVIKHAIELSRASDGVFDITVGGEMMARGNLPVMMHRQVDRTASFRDIELLADRGARMLRPLAIDLGGIAKGYAVDCAVRVLREMGVTSGCVNAGGDLRVFGDEAMPVDVRDPVDPAMIAAQVMLRERAFATSGNYASTTRFNASGLVLDPRDDAQVRKGYSASVRATSCMTADALAKCVLVLGQRSGPLLRHYEADGFVLGEGEEPMLIDTHSGNTDLCAPDSAYPTPTPLTPTGLDSNIAGFAGANL